ncbi:divalent metal cation transporter [Sphingomonas ginkgonis]|uniref:Divalent metal cation transporter MntH n=1 Tax=Sphingomonas ginkgonis TaxID=2315330 RepID=A0A429VE85_9SPHN|nr:divalent metal cation transporter [Sphingomonas ginkgonis]
MDHPHRLTPLGSTHNSVAIPDESASAWRKFAAFTGPGFLVAVGYMDPGNWATDLAGGSAFGYALLSVILLASLMAMLLQALAARLGIATGMDLAQACRAEYPLPVRIFLWLVCEAAIIACDLAEVIGTAIALQLLFGLPLLWGVLATALDVLLILYLQQKGFRRLEAFIAALLMVIAVCFVAELLLAKPSLGGIVGGLVPTPSILTDAAMLTIAVGILGATVMPHNLYLHSSIVQTRRFTRDPAGRREAIRFATLDSSVALSFAFFINAAILILAAAAFHTAGHTAIAEIGDAHRLLAPTLGVAAASTIFAVALLASGQNSTVTATLAGQIVMEGFLDLRLKPWARQLVTRGLAIAPAAFVAARYGESGTARLLILSQIVLSFQLPFAVFPLVMFTGNRRLMGEFVVSRGVRIAAWTVAFAILALNLVLIGELIA